MICAHCHRTMKTEARVLIGALSICTACVAADQPPVPTGPRVEAAPERVAEIAAYVQANGHQALLAATSKALAARVAAGPLKRRNVERTIWETEAVNAEHWKERCDPRPA